MPKDGRSSKTNSDGIENTLSTAGKEQVHPRDESKEKGKSGTVWKRKIKKDAQDGAHLENEDHDHDSGEPDKEKDKKFARPKPSKKRTISSIMCTL